MNQLDWNKAREEIKIASIDLLRPRSIEFTFKNEGALTVHLVSLWINNSTEHQHENMDLFIDSGETTTYTISYDWKTGETYTFKAITERGNIATYSATFTSSDGAMIAYGEGTITLPRYRIWNGVSWDAEASEGGASATIQWVVLKSCPARNEKILGVLSSAGDLDVSVWDGDAQTWTEPVRMASVGTTIDAYRLFDIAYEQVSGRGMIVYNPSSTGADPEFRVWNGSAWSSPQTIDIGTTGIIYWIKLASNPMSNEIAMIILDANSDVYGMIWNGTAWGNGVPLEDTASIAIEECIAVEYMQTSGKAMFVWGSGTSMYSRIWNQTSWSIELSGVNLGATCNWFSLKADSKSDKLVLVSVDGNSDLNTVRWNGASWTLDSEHDSSVETDARRCADAEFETFSGHEGHIILVWGDLNTDPITYKHFDGTSWSSAIQVSISTLITDQQWHVLRRNADDRILLACLDDGSDVNTAYWDGTQWIWSDEVETGASTLGMQCFDLSPDVHMVET